MEDSTDKNEATDPTVEPIPESFLPGDEIDWNSSRIPVQLIVELPFWLLLPSGEISLTVEECSFRAAVTSGIEIQAGQQFTRTHLSTIYIGQAAGADQVRPPITSLLEGVIIRLTRTLVTFHSTALSDAFAALSGPLRRKNQALHYFKSFAFGHLAFLNHLINTYRRVAIDPYATELSEWDVPVWFVTSDVGNLPVHLFSYPAEDAFPSVRLGPEDGRSNRYFAATVADIEAASTTTSPPGEIELMDGWSLYYRGRYGDSIRSLVTAVEVLLEAKLRDALASKHGGQAIIEMELNETRNNFWNRVDHYCELAQVRVPGPNLHYLPWLHGLRLRSEMEDTRRLRHDIVHHGRRLDHTLVGPMRRAAETTSWFFDWLSGNGDFEKRRSRHSTFLEAQRGGLRKFPFEIRPEGVIVLPLRTAGNSAGREDVGDDQLIDSTDLAELPLRTLLKSFGEDGVGRDIELFILMALVMLRVSGIHHSPPPPRDSLGQFDRFRISSEQKVILVFVLDTHGEMEESAIQQVCDTVNHRIANGLNVSGAIVVINEHNHLPWDQRPARSPKPADTFAQLNHISIVRTDDLAKLVIGMRTYQWPPQATYFSILIPGWHRCLPPFAVSIGVVRRFYPQVSVASITLIGEVRIAVGDTLAYRLTSRLHQEAITSMEQNNLAISAAITGNVGVVVSFSPNELPENAEVFLICTPS